VKHIAHLVLALAFVLVATRDSSASPPSATAFVFEAVDAVTVRGDEHMQVEGLVQGETTPRTIEFRVAYVYNSSGNYPGVSATNCHRQAMFVLAHPGRYTLELDTHSTNPNGSSVADCTIRRR
jgi:hypothetical protein